MRKLIKVKGIWLIYSLLILGCEQPKVTLESHIASKYYDNLILSLALSNPDYNCKDCLSNFPEEDKFLKSQILFKDKIVCDDSSRIKMILHTWTNYGGDFPKSVISIADTSGFLYAFNFYDEYYYSLRQDRIGNEIFENQIRRVHLSDDLNFAARQLNHNKVKNSIYMNRFITLFADSLLGLHEYNTSDTAAFRNELNVILSVANGEICKEGLKKNINEMVMQASGKNIRFFSTHEGEFAFWKFELVNRKGKIKLVATLANQECYTVFLM